MGAYPYKCFAYDGPVMEFDKCISNRWRASTYAPSCEKARSNLVYRFKKENNRAVSSKIILPGKIVMID